MRPLIQEIPAPLSPECLIERLGNAPGIVLLRSASFDSPQARYSFVTANPFLTFRSFGSRCEIKQLETRNSSTLRSKPATEDGKLETSSEQFGNPWHLLDALMSRYELLDEIDLPFPLGGCFGYWGYDLKNFVEPKLRRRAVNDLELPDCHVGFYDSLVVFDHRLGKISVVATGLDADGSRTEERARAQAARWKNLFTDDHARPLTPEGERGKKTSNIQHPTSNFQSTPPNKSLDVGGSMLDVGCSPRTQGERTTSNLTRPQFLAAVTRAQQYIRAGDIYQVNLSQRLAAPCPVSGWEFFQQLLNVSPAPFAAYLNCGDFQIASSSPEQFLRMSGPHITTRPIKGTRPRSPDSNRDAQLAYELQTSAKELSELVMITDLMRNDLGKICEFGSVQVPELAKLERFAQVQHLVSTVEGRLRNDVTHFAALASCFPGGSITGAPKFRAMEIIDELEPIARGPYTGCHGYLGFNRESQLSVSIRTAIRQNDTAYFHVGAGIVADSISEAEYDETLAKAGGFFAALNHTNPTLIATPKKGVSPVN